MKKRSGFGWLEFIEGVLLILLCSVGTIVLGSVVAAVLAYSLLCVLLLLLASLLALLALKLGNGAVDGCVALCLGHTGKLLQRVLQLYGIGIRHKLVENL